MTRNEMIYRSEINSNPDFKVTMEEFDGWLEEQNMLWGFRSDVESIEDDIDRYRVAVDYSIPLSMVRAYEHRFSFITYAC